MRKTTCSLLLSVVLGLWAKPACGEPDPKATKGEILGQVTDAATGQPLIGATVTMVGRFGGAIADTSGQFRLTNLPGGSYTLRFSHVGYQDSQTAPVELAAGASLTLNAALVEKLTTLKGIIVTPGRFDIMGTEPTAQQTLTRGEIETVPQLGDDFFRAVTRLPGMSGNDFSTRFVVRGGEYDEVLVTLDGLQIYEPFHLRDIDGGAISVVDVAAVEGIELMTGGYTAEYGDKMSGVFNIKSRQVPPDRSRLTLGLSMMNTRLLLEGNYAGNKGSWLLSARRGYIDLVLKLADPGSKIKPTYYDVFAKTRYQLSDRHVLGANVLHAGDDLHYFGEEEDIGDTVRSNYGNSYGWLTLWSEFHPRLTNQTIASFGQVRQDRSGQLFVTWIPGVDLTARNKKDFRFAQLKSDWEYEMAENSFLRFGADAKWMTAEYDYLSGLYQYGYHVSGDSSYVTLDRIDTTSAVLKPSGEKLGFYLSNRYRPWQPVTIELGLRYDRTTYSSEDLLSPRVGMVFDLATATTLRTGWGRYQQSEGIDEIMVGDGETGYHPAERADHWVAGLQHDFDNGVHLRVEAYYKKYSNLRPDYRNSFDDIEAFPELEYDRTVVFRGESSSRGLEFYLKKDTRGKISWWASYAMAKCEDDVSAIGFMPKDVTIAYGRKLPTPNDQRHTLYLDLSYRPSHKWQFNLALQFHTGWPYTGVHAVEAPLEGGGTRIYLQSDEQLSSRHSNYRRFDLRINRYFRVGSGRITAFVELINVFGFDNVRGYSYDIRLGGPSGYYVDSEAETWFGRLPSFGVAYEVNL
jgi:hypothetical protein